MTDSRITPARTAAWHHESATEVLTRLGSLLDGLSDEEASSRLATYGPNRLPPPIPVSRLEILVAQLKNVIVVLLTAAIVISLLTGDRIEAAAILAVLVINTALGFITELRARRAIEALSSLDVPRATVVRAGQLRSIDAHDLVPGDVVAAEAGRQVPADARLLTAEDLHVDEAPLTGESLPVSKSSEPVPADTLLADRRSMIYKGTTVTAGHGRAVVVGTGVATEVGRIGGLVSGVVIEPTPLERKLEVLGARLVWITIGIAAVVAALGAMHGLPLELVIETSIALAVAAVPEALPVVATIALAVGVRRMARRHALVRHLPAVEALGSATVVCTDKTRTLTSGEMAVVRVWAGGRVVAIDRDAPGALAGDPDVVRLIDAAARASRRQPAGSTTAGDPVDHAMFGALRAVALDPDGLLVDPPVGAVPFSSARKRLVLFYARGSTTAAYIKGAAGPVLDACATVSFGDRREPIDAARHAELLRVNDALAGEGLRVLAVATGSVSQPTEEALTDLTVVGFVGLADPPAPGVRETVSRLRAAGMRTVMLTGDQRLTAEAIGRDVGVLDETDSAVDGHALEGLTPGEAQDLVGRHAAFTRIAPEHKLTVVRALQARGDIVAMLGDGINDAAALKQADVGVAMGVRGTDIAKEAASIVLLDDRFETIAAAVEEGRVVFDNIRKFVFYLFSCNVAEILVLLIAALAALPLPLGPLQLLWLNLVTDTFPALALAMEPADGDVMRRPPRPPDDEILSRSFLWRVLFYGGLITIVTLIAYVWALGAAPDRASTMAFMTLAFAQAAHLGTARSADSVLVVRRALANSYAIGGVALAIGLQLLAIHVAPLAELLHVVPLTPANWALVVGLSVVPALVAEAVKFVTARAVSRRV